jgi:hypothetical protein
LLDLDPRGRVIACALFFGSEALLILTAPMRSDRSYGFRMFPESSTLTVHLSRRLQDGTLVPVENGRWQARDCKGTGYSITWGKMVHSPAPSKLDVAVGAPYGVESEIHRTRDAMQWVLDHTKEDCETQAFVAQIKVRRNGTPSYQVEVETTRSGAEAKADER